MIPMRRKRQLLAKEVCEEILNRATSGVLAFKGEDFPYAVPLSYAYEENKLYFHCAKQGYKLDLLKSCNKVSFCVIGQDQIVPERFTTYFQSVIAYGTASLVESDEEKRYAVELIAKKYAPNESKEHRDREIEREWTPLAVIRLDVEEMTGKQAIELVNA